MKRLYFLLPFYCLSLCGCSNNDDSITIKEVIDCFSNEKIEMEKGKYNLRSYFDYKYSFALKKKSFEGQRINTLSFEYDEKLINISQNFSYYDDDEYLYVTYSIEPISSYDVTTIKAYCYNTDKSYSFDISSSVKKAEIGKTTIATADSDIAEYIDSLNYYQFENKERLRNVDKSLYELINFDSFKSPNKRERESKVRKNYYGASRGFAISIKTNDVTRFIFDSIYMPDDIGQENIVYYYYHLPNSDEFDYDDFYLALFMLDSTGVYPLTRYHSKNSSFVFEAFHQKASMLKIDYFKANADSFYKTNINDITCYMWKEGEVYIPFDYICAEEGSINIAFSFGNYIYFVSSLMNA